MNGNYDVIFNKRRQSVIAKLVREYKTKPPRFQELVTLGDYLEKNTPNELKINKSSKLKNKRKVANNKIRR